MIMILFLDFQNHFMTYFVAYMNICLKILESFGLGKLFSTGGSEYRLPKKVARMLGLCDDRS